MVEIIRGFEAIVIGGKIRVRIETCSPVTIGSGKSTVDPLAPDIPLLRDSQGRPIIPGSTLKGFFRSYIEKSLLAADIKNAANIIDDLFGRTIGGEGWGSKILFSDAIVKNNYKILSREHIQLDPQKMSVKHGPFEQEYIPADTVFEGIIDFRNIPPSMLSLLAPIILFTKIGVARIGRSKSRGYGCIEIKFDDPMFFLVGDFTDEEVEVKYRVKLANMNIEINVSKKNEDIKVRDNITQKTFSGKIEMRNPLMIFTTFKWSDIEKTLDNVLKKLKGEK